MEAKPTTQGVGVSTGLLSAKNYAGQHHSGKSQNDDSLERYAREHYLMKREGETIYIIKE